MRQPYLRHEEAVGGDDGVEAAYAVLKVTATRAPLPVDREAGPPERPMNHQQGVPEDGEVQWAISRGFRKG